MARPKWHISHSVILTAVYCLSVPFVLVWQGAVAIFLIFSFGVLVDIDHMGFQFFRNFSLRKIKNLIAGNVKDLELQPVGWVNYLHTWQAMIGVGIFSVIMGNWLPVISYSIHIAVDGANRANLEAPASPLPKVIHHFYPHCLTYYYNG